ncbi:hypothetical protein ACL1CX_01995 [Corynebacterium striatum]|uniref:hypothetical protein n=1 Tax=Corynebacterium striatum TaxID=43770 RepID=UPI001A3406C6|nr:hypothetical protein [Corynebacterium striatum]
MNIHELIHAHSAGTTLLIVHDYEGRHYQANLDTITNHHDGTWTIQYGQYTRRVHTNSNIDAHITRR